MEEWIVAFIGGIIGSAITFIVGIFTLRFNYRQLYAQTVSSTREKWLCILRENLSKFISCAEILNYGKLNFCKKSVCEKEKELLEAKAMILSRLNLAEEKHLALYYAINTLSYNSNVNFEAQKDCVMKSARILMKDEWELVKAEARGKKINRGKSSEK